MNKGKEDAGTARDKGKAEMIEEGFGRGREMVAN
jgi:hypothetical protein